jgi:hypothetical protein
MPPLPFAPTSRIYYVYRPSPRSRRLDALRNGYEVSVTYV